LSVIEREAVEAHIRKCLELVGLRDAIMVAVHPQTQLPVDGIVPGDPPIAIAAVLGVVEYGEREETVRTGLERLLRKGSEQLETTVNQPITVAVESEPGIVRFRKGPRQLLGTAAGSQVENHAVVSVRQPDAVSSGVDNNGRAELRLTVRAHVI